MNISELDIFIAAFAGGGIAGLLIVAYVFLTLRSHLNYLTREISDLWDNIDNPRDKA